MNGADRREQEHEALSIEAGARGAGCALDGVRADNVDSCRELLSEIRADYVSLNNDRF